VSVRNASHSSSRRLRSHHARPSVARDHVEVDAVRALEVDGREQVRHDLVDVDAVRARRDHEPRRVLVVRLVAQVLDHRQLLRTHLRAICSSTRLPDTWYGSSVITISPSSTS
jgi:hypothetical protein